MNMSNKVILLTSNNFSWYSVQRITCFVKKIWVSLMLSNIKTIVLLQASWRSEVYTFRMHNKVRKPCKWLFSDRRLLFFVADVVHNNISLPKKSYLIFFLILVVVATNWGVHGCVLQEMKGKKARTRRKK